MLCVAAVLKIAGMRGTIIALRVERLYLTTTCGCHNNGWMLCLFLFYLGTRTAVFPASELGSQT